MSQIEYERKKLISHDEYQYYHAELKKCYNYSVSNVMQINYYYDDKDFSLLKTGETLRVRQIENILICER